MWILVQEGGHHAETLMLLACIEAEPSQKARLQQKRCHLASERPFPLAGGGEAESVPPLESDIHHGNRQLSLCKPWFLHLGTGAWATCLAGLWPGWQGTASASFLEHYAGTLSSSAFFFLLSVFFLLLLLELRILPNNLKLGIYALPTIAVFYIYINKSLLRIVIAQGFPSLKPLWVTRVSLAPLTLFLKLTF